jgi:5'-3' exonuclease
MRKERRVYLIDGNSTVYISDWKPGMRNASGKKISGIKNFLARIQRYVNEVGRENVFVMWDSRNYKKKLDNPEYKAHRVHDDHDHDIWAQIDSLKVALPLLGIGSFEIDGFESDQLVASFALHYNEYDIVIVSQDSDMFQLISDRITVLINKKKEALYMTPEIFKKEYDWTPQQFVVRKIMMGDKSDNIAGVEGFDGYAFRRLVKKYPEAGVEELLASYDLQPFEKQIKKNKGLIQLGVDVDPIEMEKLLHSVGKVEEDLFMNWCLETGLMYIVRGFQGFILPFLMDPDFSKQAIVVEEKRNKKIE